MNNIAVIGLGSMGYGIASSCLRSGHSVWGVDTNNKLMTKFCDLGGQKSHLDDSILDIDVVVVVSVAAPRLWSLSLLLWL